jgi:biotin transporter BioY
MAKNANNKLLNFVAWLTGVIVSLSVGFAMIDNILSLPSYLGGMTVAMIAGWVVVITTAVSVVLAIVHYFK